jgi:phospholipase C/spore coat protein U-like protein
MPNYHTPRARSATTLLPGACLLATAALIHPAAAFDPPSKTKTIPIQHVIVIMQENRSFDSYFGTYPGANGIPQGTCVPINPAQPTLGCVVPFHDPHDVNAGGLHSGAAAIADLDNGITSTNMDGFIAEQNAGSGFCSTKVKPGAAPGTEIVTSSAGGRSAGGCKGFAPGIARHDAVGYHTAAELSSYWSYAQHFVLQDQMFESVRSYSNPAHLYLTSEWSAICTKPSVLSTCTSTLEPAAVSAKNPVPFPWVNLFQLMDTHGVSWKYYLASGTEPDCVDGEMTCEPQQQSGGLLSYWNPVPGFAWVANQGSAYLTAHNPDVDQFLVDIKNGTLPQVSWVIPAANYSEHPIATITSGMEYVTSIVNAVMQSPYWQNTAIFISWDDWGGFYDHVVPPNVDKNNTNMPIQGYGLRVPGLLVSAYAKPGYIDHSVLSFDSYATLIEDLFMNSARLDPVAMGQPDNRPDVRDELTSVTFPNGTTAPIGKLINEFDFTQTPLAPVVLSTHIPTGIALTCASADVNNPQNCTTNAVKVTWRTVTGPEVPEAFTYQLYRDGGATPICTVTKTTCTDTKSGSGVHLYTVDSVSSTGVVSPQSAAAEADVP